MQAARTALVVEEEFLIALDVQRVLETVGVHHSHFARNATEARSLGVDWSTLSVAVVAIASSEDAHNDLVRELLDARVPLVLTTADARPRPPELDHVPVIIKPAPERDLAEALRRALHPS